jgi:hypothetical protein
MAFATIDVTKGITGVLPSANATYTSLRKNANPIIINGNMAVSQRGTSFTSNGYTVDRFTFDESTDGAVTVTQDSTVPSGQGFGKSVKFDVTTADSSIEADQYCQWTQFIEGQNLQLLKYGTSSAENLTLAFWVRSNKTGTYGVRFVKEAGGQTRYECPIEYSISSADTWEKKIINLSPTAGSTTFITNSAGAIVNSNASGYRIAWILTSGSNKHGTNNTWTTTSDRMGTTNQVNFLDNTSNELYITGIQLEVGEFTSTTIPPFQHEDFGDNLSRCKRYYQTTIMPDTSDYWGQGYYYTNSEFTCKMPIQEMRAQPTLDQVSGSNYFTVYSNNAGDTINDFSLDGSSSRRCVSFTDTGESSGTAGFGGGLYKTNASARFAFDADL